MKAIFHSKSYHLAVVAAALLLSAASANEASGGGIGTAGDPYLIATAADLSNIRTNLGTTVNYVYYRQTADIDLSGYTNWQPIAPGSPSAYVHFDGGNHSISNLNISRSGTSNVGLFGHLSGSIRNLALESGAVVGNTDVGAFAGMLFNGTISNCASRVTVSGASSAGGLVGWNQGGTIQYSTARGGGVSGSIYVGGLVGYNAGGSLAYSFAAMTNSGTSNAGGLVGYASGGTVTACYWDKEVSGKSTSAGSPTNAGLTTAQMQQRENFAGWDFTSTWQLYTGKSYPYLRALAQTVEDPVLTPGSGAYPGSVVSVTADCATPGATIHYTTGRTNPANPDDTTTNAVPAGGSVSVPIPATLKAVAWKAYMNPSAVVTNSYEPALTVATPAATPGPGSYAGTNLTVAISCATTGTVIRYTIDESGVPDENSTPVPPSGEVTIPLPSTLRAKAWRDDLNPSQPLVAVYSQMPIVETPIFNPDGGTFTGSFVNVTITNATAGATIYYTTNGVDPTTNSSPVVGAVTVPVPGTLKAKAWKVGYTESAVKRADYAPAGAAAKPVFDPDGGPVAAGYVSVLITCTNAGAVIRYTTDGSDPTETSATGDSGIAVKVPVPGTLKAKAWVDGLDPSTVKSNEFFTAAVVATPTFSPDGGVGSVGTINVTLSCATSGAQIHYTTNGLDPTQADPSGTSVAVPLPSTLKAKAYKTGLFSSAVRLAYYGDFAGGRGTSEDPYRLATAAHLNKVRDYLNAHYLVIADIDLGVSPWNGGQGWLPIDDGGNGFVGTFDGGGHVVSNLTIARATAEYVGLFGYVGASGRILNLGILSGSVAGKNHVGGLAGTNVGTISNAFARCSVSASISYAGGLIGSADPGSLLTDAYASGNVTSAFSRAGGLVGLVNGSTILRCYAVGSVGAPSEAGGLIGQALSGVPVASYWDTQASGLSGSDGGEGRPTSEMKQQATFSGWNFANVWRIDEGVDYPRLRVFDPASSSAPPDSWLIRFYGAVAAAPETSVRDWPQYWEYVADTDPTDPASQFAVTTASSVTNSLSMSVNSSTGRVYSLLSRTSLTTGDWQPAAGVDEQTGTGAPLEFTLPAPSGPTFYRLGVRLAE